MNKSIEDHEINVLTLVKGVERYVFLFDEMSRSESLKMLARYASNPELSFSWYDAAILSQKIRQDIQESKAVPHVKSAIPSEAE